MTSGASSIPPRAANARPHFPHMKRTPIFLRCPFLLSLFLISSASPLEFIAVRQDEVSWGRVVVAGGVGDDVFAVQEVVDGEHDVAGFVWRVFHGHAGQEVWFHAVGMSSSRRLDAVCEVGEVEGCGPFLFFVAYAAGEKDAAVRAVPVSLGGCFFCGLLAFRVLPCEACVPGEAVVFLASDAGFDAVVLEVFVDGIPASGGAGVGDVVVDFFGEEGDFVLAVGFFFLPACFVVEAFLRFQVRVSDDVADAACLLAGVHLAEGRKDEGLSYAGVEALRIVQFVQVLCLAAEVVEVLDAAGGPCAAAAQGQDVLGREISFPGSEGGDDVASGIARFIFKGFPDEGCADQEGLVRISIPYFLHVVAVGLVLFLAAYGLRRRVFLAG